MFEILPVNSNDNILAFKVTGKLTDNDYKQFLPTLEEAIRKSGPLSLYVEMQDFEGWEVKAAWDDLRFDLQHDDDFKRIAIIADQPFLHAAIKFVNFFSHIDMRFFNKDESAIAWDWLNEKPQPVEPLKPVQAYKNILLPTDFSIYSDMAASRALQISQQYNATLQILHTVENFTYYNDAFDPLITEIQIPDEVFMTQAQENMKKFCERNELGDEVIIEIQWSDPKDGIISWAKEKQNDLIVMGMHSRHGIERLLGSVSNAVLHDAPCDVLIVK